MRLTGALLLMAAGCASSAPRVGNITRENDGAWVCTFDGAGRDAAYHAALGVFEDKGYELERVNPLAGSFSARSKVETRFNRIRYRIARVDIESASGGGVRIRLRIVRTQEPEGAGRRPNNDRAVNDETLYDDIFARIARVLAA